MSETDNAGVLASIAAAFPSWGAYALPFVPPPAGGDPHEAHIEISCPKNGRDHSLAVRVFDNTVEVSYSVGLGLGPAEAQFVADTDNPSEVVSEVISFIERLVAGEVRVVRDRSLFSSGGQLRFHSSELGRGTAINWLERWQLR